MAIEQMVPGGKYLRPDGKTYVDANGNVLKGDPDSDKNKQKVQESEALPRIELEQEHGGESGATAGRTEEDMQARVEDTPGLARDVSLPQLEEYLKRYSNVQQLQELKEADWRKGAKATYDARIAELS